MGNENLKVLGVEGVFVLDKRVVDEEFVIFGEAEDFVDEFVPVVVE